MATLKKNKKRNGKIMYWAMVRYVKWAKAKHINLNTDSITTARVRLNEVERKEKELKQGLEFSWTWGNNEGLTLIKQMTFADAIKQWLEIKAINVSEGTHRRYIITMNAFMNVVGDVTPISSITNQNIEDFKRFYSKFHTPCGININLRGIKAFLRWSYDEGLIKKMPKIKMMKEPKPLPKYITEKNWRDIMELEGLGDWWKNVFRMYVTTGMRRSEVLYGCIDGSFLIVPAEFTKAKRELEIPLNDFQLNTVRAIQKARDEHIAKGSKLVTFKSKITKKFTDACKEIGVYESKKTTLHCLRHTFAVKKYLETRDIYEVCKRLNHDKLSTTLIYSKFSWKRLEQDFPTLVSKEPELEECTPAKCTPDSNSLYVSPLQMN